MRIGIDLMGSDTSPQILFEAVIHAAAHFDASYTFLVLATRPVVDILQILRQPTLEAPHAARIEFHLVTDTITMSDEPLTAVRHKKGSSLVQGVRLLKKRMIDAFISTGNTGALIASATLSLPMLPGIRRPALLAVVPTEKGTVAVVDVGGNVYCKAHHLVQFAQMGAAFQRCSQGIQVPRVGLLNIGVESKKGTNVLRQAYQQLEAFREGDRMAFLGNVEGREVFQGKVDVLVTDGFTGNVFLKSSEGAAAFILDSLAKATDPSSTLQQSIGDLVKRFQYQEYPGAIVCGVDGVLIKCHGDASPLTLFNGIKGAVTLVKGHLLQQIKAQLVATT